MATHVSDILGAFDNSDEDDDDFFLSSDESSEEEGPSASSHRQPTPIVVVGHRTRPGEQRPILQDAVPENDITWTEVRTFNPTVHSYTG